MVTRKRIGLCYTYNENWIGGTYYIENLINALNTLADIEKPHIVLITNKHDDFRTAKDKLVYPYINFQMGSGEKNRIFQFINKVSKRLFDQTIFHQKIENLDAVLPYYKCIQQSLARKKIYWIADFQEHFAPGFFNQETIEARKKSQMEIQSSSENLIVSSNDALQHFKSLYPNHVVKVHVLPFAVTHPDFNRVNLRLLLKKFTLPERYFICPNQFWKHKNQFSVIKAVNELKNNGIEITVAFTGNTQDHRNPDYFIELKSYVKENDLGNQIKFLGFIDRTEQLQLMKNSIAIIQPSLFEGWSTVVEDAKSMNKFLIVSDIDVHKEQLTDSAASFFDPLNVHELADALKNAFNQLKSPDLYDSYCYANNVKTFADTFLKIAI